MLDKRESWMLWLYRPIEKWLKPLHVAIRNKNLLEIVSLKNSGTDFSVKTKDGGNLLHLLAEINPSVETTDKTQEEIFDLLMNEYNFDVTATDVNGKSALHIAAEHDNRPIARKLIDHGAKVDSRDKNMATPLHRAVIANNVELADLLLRNGANVNAKDCEGIRPIHLAVSPKPVAMLGLLVAFGVCLDVRDCQGQTALFKAISRGYEDCVQNLLVYGADVTNDSSVVRLMNESVQNMKMLPGLRSVVIHLTKLLAVGIPHRELSICKILEALPGKLERFQDEILWLQSNRINDRTSVYEFLRMNPNERCKFSRRCTTELSSFVYSFNAHKVPHLSHLVMACYYQSRERKRLLNLAKDAWLELTGVGLPDLCVDRVLAHLSNLELMKMVDRDEN